MTARFRWLLGWMWVGVAVAAEEPAWDVSATGSLSVADGNSDSLAYSLQLQAIQEGEFHELRLGFDHFYAETASVESANSTKLHEQFSWDLDERWYLSQYASALTDAVADTDYRLDVSLMLGCYLWQTDRSEFSIEWGPGYAWEEKANASDHYMTARLGQRFEFHFDDHTRLWQSFGWTPQVEDPSSGIYEFELGLENQLNAILSLRTFIRHRVDAAPAAGSGRSDTALMVGLNYDFTADEDGSTEARDLAGSFIGSTIGIKDGWETTAAMGLTMNRGNADKSGLKLDWHSDYDSEERELSWEFSYHFSEDNGQTSTDQLRARLQGNHYVDDVIYLGAAAGFLRDDLAGIDYRLTPSLLFGRAWIRNERTEWSVDVGPQLTLEQTGDGSNEYASIALAQRLEHQISERVALDHSIEATTAIEDPAQFILTTRFALDTELSDSLKWRCEVESRYESEPAVGRKHHDLLLTSGVVVTF